jgi:uncharacterized protein YdeI (YjbR/CyaY-like superfamily)
MNRNPKVDLYLEEGCGRCKLYKTPACKVHKWSNELQALRKIVLECGLTEEIKWGMPVYTHHTKNTIILGAFKDYCLLGFCKGALLKDSENILVKQGESSQSVRILKWTSSKDILTMEPILKEYIREAIEIEKLGLKVVFKKNLEAIPLELQDKLDKDPAFAKSFQSLPLGKQRGYILYFSQPKQTTTRERRIQNSVQKILNGKGMNDS